LNHQILLAEANRAVTPKLLDDHIAVVAGIDEMLRDQGRFETEWFWLQHKAFVAFPRCVRWIPWMKEGAGRAINLRPNTKAWVVLRRAPLLFIVLMRQAEARSGWA
jgi:hypothetical protein